MSVANVDSYHSEVAAAVDQNAQVVQPAGR